MKISVVIPVFNGAETLRTALDAVYRSSTQPHEVIVVDDCSTDESASIASDYPCQLIRLPRNLGVGRARNVGARRASGDLFFFTDADVEIETDTIAHGLSALEDRPELCAVVGLYGVRCGAPNFCSDFKNLCYHHVHSTSAEETSLFIGNCGLLRREAFEEIGGFEERSTFSRVLEDVDLGMRLTASGKRIALNKAMHVTHHRRFSFVGLMLSDLFKRAIPWTKLLLHHRRLRLDNCTRASDALAVSAAQAGLVSSLLLFSSSVHWLMPVAAVSTVIGQDAELYYFLSKQRGALFLLRAVPMRLVYYLLAGLGAAISILQASIGALVGAQQAKARVHEG